MCKLKDNEILELNKLIRTSKLDIPIHKREVTKHNQNYVWLQKNLLVKNKDKITPRLKELLDINL